MLNRIHFFIIDLLLFIILKVDNINIFTIFLYTILLKYHKSSNIYVSFYVVDMCLKNRHKLKKIHEIVHKI